MGKNEAEKWCNSFKKGLAIPDAEIRSDTLATALALLSFPFQLHAMQ